MPSATVELASIAGAKAAAGCAGAHALVVTGAPVLPDFGTTDGTDPRVFGEAVRADSVASNAVSRGFPVSLSFPAPAERQPS